jgi:hypothetical protein
MLTGTVTGAHTRDRDRGRDRMARTIAQDSQLRSVRRWSCAVPFHRPARMAHGCAVPPPHSIAHLPGWWSLVPARRQKRSAARAAASSHRPGPGGLVSLSPSAGSTGRLAGCKLIVVRTRTPKSLRQFASPSRCVKIRAEQRTSICKKTNPAWYCRVLDSRNQLLRLRGFKAPVFSVGAFRHSRSVWTSTAPRANRASCHSRPVYSVFSFYPVYIR